MVGRLEPDVVITQLEMRLEEAEEILSRLRWASPGSRIVVLIMLDNLHYMRALSKLEIDAYLHKSSSAQELFATVDALGRAPAGQNAVVSIPRGMLQRLEEGPAGGLSSREMEVLVLAARGLSNHRILLSMGRGPQRPATPRRSPTSPAPGVRYPARSEDMAPALPSDVISRSRASSTSVSLGLSRR